MFKKLIHRVGNHYKYLLFIIVVFLINPFPSEGLSVRVYPRSPHQGDVCLLEIESDRLPSAMFGGRAINVYRNGSSGFVGLLPVSQSTPPGRYAILINDGVNSRKEILTVKKRLLKPIWINLPPKNVFPGPEELERIEKESKILDEIWKKETAPRWDGAFIPPLNSGINTPFGVPRILNGKKKSLHRGVDFRAPGGTPIKAINSGTIVIEKELYFGGKTVIIDHGGGVYSVYMHLSRFLKPNGDYVKKGEVIGLSGSSGRASGPHLHLSVKVSGVSIDPLSLFNLPL